MRKIIKLTRDELVEQIRKSITKNLYEQDYSADMERATQPREFQVKDIFGPTYSRYIPNDVIRYMRKTLQRFFKDFLTYMVKRPLLTWKRLKRKGVVHLNLWRNQ